MSYVMYEDLQRSLHKTYAMNVMNRIEDEYELTEKQKKGLIRMLQSARHVTLRDVAAVIDIDKQVVRQILITIMKCGIITKTYNGAWKVTPEGYAILQAYDHRI